MAVAAGRSTFGIGGTGGTSGSRAFCVLGSIFQSWCKFYTRWIDGLIDFWVFFFAHYYFIFWTHLPANYDPALSPRPRGDNSTPKVMLLCYKDLRESVNITLACVLMGVVADHARRVGACGAEHRTLASYAERSTLVVLANCIGG